LEHGVLVGSAVLLPLTEALDDPDTLQDFVAELGWELPASATAIGLDPAHVGAVVTAFEDVVALGDTVPDDATVAARYAVLLGALAVLGQDVYDLRTSIAAHLDAAFLNASQIAQQLPKRLFDYLLMEYVREANEPVYQALVVAGIFETTDVPRGPATFTSEHVQRTVHYDRARTLLTDPKDLFQDVYGWGDAAARLDLLIDRLYELGDSLGVPVALRYPLLEAELALNSPGTVVLDGEATQPELDLPLLATRVGGHIAFVGVLTGVKAEITTAHILQKSLRITGVYVGSRQMFEDMNRVFEQQQLRPVIDRVYAMTEVKEALRYMESARHFGKIVLQLT